MKPIPAIWTLVVVAGAALLVMVCGPVRAHCDTMDGPVATAGVRALEIGDLRPALKWVAASQEAELRAAFEQARSLRSRGTEVRDVVDAYFLETLVRLHRASEGEPYTGLRPAGLDPGPAVRAAEQALATGSSDRLVEELTALVRAGAEQRLAATLEARRAADESVEKGRAYVAAYADFVHYVRAVHETARVQPHARRPGATP